MTSWYDIRDFDTQCAESVDEARRGEYSQEEIRDSVRIITELIDEEVAILQGQHDKIYIGGFSQGCAITLATFLLYSKGQLGGVVGLSGCQSMAIDYASNEVDLPLKRQTKMFLYHGEDDPLISVITAEESYQEFKERQLDFSFQKESGLTHSLSDEEILKITDFFSDLMDE